MEAGDFQGFFSFIMENYKYNILINQRAVIENNLDLDLIDCAIFDFIKSFSNSPRCTKIQADDGIFFWISHKLIIEQMPLLGIKTPQGIIKRIDKLIIAGMIERSANCEALGKSIYRFGPAYDKMEFTPHNESLGFPQQEFRVPHNESLGNNNINNNNIEDKGEAPAPEISFEKKSFKKWDRDDFKKSIEAARDQRKQNPKLSNFSGDMLRSFFSYWSEPDANGRMRFQKQDTWATLNRLSTWMDRENKRQH